jgi:hypothetical protein
VIRRDEYPLAEWRILFNREAAVQTKFFEALLEKK